MTNVCCCFSFHNILRCLRRYLLWRPSRSTRVNLFKVRNPVLRYMTTVFVLQWSINIVFFWNAAVFLLLFLFFGLPFWCIVYAHFNSNVFHVLCDFHLSSLDPHCHILDPHCRGLFLVQCRRTTVATSIIFQIFNAGEYLETDSFVFNEIQHHNHNGNNAKTSDRQRHDLAPQMFLLFTVCFDKFTFFRDQIGRWHAALGVCEKYRTGP